MELVAGAHLNAPVADVPLLPSSVHEVFLVSSAQAQVVARFNAASELGRLQKEAWCIARAAEVGVLGPRVLAVGTEGGYAFMLQSFVSGRRGDVLAGDERRQMWHGLGGDLRRIHVIAVAGFGDELTELTHDDRGAAWQRYLGYNLSSLTPADRLVELGVLDQRAQIALRSAFNRLRRRQTSIRPEPRRPIPVERDRRRRWSPAGPGLERGARARRASLRPGRRP